MKDDRTFGQRLRETRVGAGMSQSDLEEISGIPKALNVSEEGRRSDPACRGTRQDPDAFWASAS